MEFTLQVNTQTGTTIVRLFKDPASPRSYKEFTCFVSYRGNEYQSDIPAAELQNLLQFVRSSNASAMGGCALGIDGVLYELSIKEGVAHVTYRWWMTPTPGWKPLSEIASMLLQLGVKVSGQYLP